VLKSCPDVLAWLVELTETHSNLSLRGTGFCVLDLFAKSEAGREELQRLGWEVGGGVVRGLEYYMPITVPRDISRMLRIPTEEFTGSPVSFVKPTSQSLFLGEGSGGSLDMRPEELAPKPAPPSTASSSATAATPAPPPPPNVEEEIFELIVKLSNYVSKKEAQDKLGKLWRKQRYKRKFRSLRFYLRIHELIGQYT
jgi:hypothetical protein